MEQIYSIGIYAQVLTSIKEIAEGTGFNIKIDTKLYKSSTWINYIDTSICSSNKYHDHGYLLAQYQIPRHIDYTKFHESFDVIYGDNTNFYVCMKYQDIISCIKTLLNQPAPITLISNTLSCENLREAIKNNFCAEIKYQLAQVFTTNIDKIFAMIQPAEIDKQVSQLLICIINSQPLEANIKNAASKLLIEWTPTFTQYMIEKFRARTLTS